ncbi:MAG: hypothetical protein WD360_01950 [Nitriliruptoraceae bacterium]
MTKFRELTDEQQLLRGVATTLGVVVVVVVPGAWILKDGYAALSAAIGLLFVALMSVGSAAILAHVTRSQSPFLTGSGGVMTLAAAAIIRLPVYLLALWGLSRVAWVDPRSLAIAAVIGIVVTLVYELRLASALPRLFWIDTSVAPPTVTATDARSEPL